MTVGLVADRLRALADRSERRDCEWRSDLATLTALSPELALWAADAAKMIRDSIPCYGWRRDHTFNHAACNEAKPCPRCAFLARLAGIVGEPE